MNKQFESIILNELSSYTDYTYEIRESYSNRLQIIGKDNVTNDIVFRIILNIDNEYPKEVQIPVIIVREGLKYKGIGKKIIYLIYNACVTNQYRLFLVDLVNSFYERLVNRGAQIIEPYEVVEITENTRLI